MSNPLIALCDSIKSSVYSLQSCPGVIPALLTSLRFFADKVLHSDLLSSVNTFLVNIYPPSPENHILALQIFGGVAHLVATCNEKNILQLLVLLKDSLSLWFKDAAKSLLQQEHNILVRFVLDCLFPYPYSIPHSRLITFTVYPLISYPSSRPQLK